MKITKALCVAGAVAVLALAPINPTNPTQPQTVFAATILKEIVFLLEMLVSLP
ncbi:hypothetical protein [Streptococcus equi]|uniref:hypothetical protein n=1 Tax=Streptococcus equi TaxID=1336 RepID=UPI001E5895F0|nr:hypothetical protein [Streptococcus equi]